MLVNVTHKDVEEHAVDEARRTCIGRTEGRLSHWAHWRRGHHVETLCPVIQLCAGTVPEAGGPPERATSTATPADLNAASPQVRKCCVHPGRPGPGNKTCSVREWASPRPTGKETEGVRSSEGSRACPRHTVVGEGTSVPPCAGACGWRSEQVFLGAVSRKWSLSDTPRTAWRGACWRFCANSHHCVLGCYLKRYQL